MLRRKKNRQRSNTRTLERNRTAQHRNTQGRKMSVEGLQNRQLMAADFGMDDFIIMGPQPAAYVSTPTPVANVVATAETDDPNVFWYETNGLTPNVFKDGSKIRINGTLLRDEIEFTQTGDRVEILAKTYNNSGELMGVARGMFRADIFGKIDADLFSGDDLFDARGLRVKLDVEGGNGHDTIFGGRFDDTIKGGAGHDTITSQLGKNKLYGDAGDDRIEGGFRSDTIKGGAGDDWIYGHAGVDKLYGNDGNDRIYGGNQKDYIYGGDGRDRIYGQDGNDVLSGNDGNDALYGGDGTDTLYGHKGNDMLSGGDGVDTLAGHEGHDTMHGNDGDDVLYGADGNDRLYGGDGNDTMYGQDGLDRLYGGNDNDYLHGGDDGIRDLLYGGAGSDTFVKSQANWFWQDDDPDEFMDLTGIDGIELN